MTPERWQQVKKILEEALELDAASRPAHLAAACTGDIELRREVESLLIEGEADFLERPALDHPPRVPDAALEQPAKKAFGPVTEVHPIDLAPYSKLSVSTRGSRYELIAVAPLDKEFLIKGGRRFPETTRVCLLRQDAIRVGEELRLLVGTRKLTTTAITDIEIVG